MSPDSHDVIAAILSKPLHLSKLRLSHILTGQQRRELSLNMLHDVVRTLKEAGLAEILCITSDPAIEVLSKGLGLTIIREPKPRGVNQAARLALSHSRKNGAKTTLLIPADIPFVTTSDLEICLKTHLDHRLTLISPSRRFDGTNLIIVNSQRNFEFHYEEDGFSAHVVSALKVGEGVCVYYSPTIALDIDTEDDLRDASMKRGSSRTSRFLRALKLKGKLEQG